MSATLSASDLALLGGYQQAGDRYDYWSLLASKGDLYAKLALSVVDGDSVSGWIGGHYAASFATGSMQDAESTAAWWNLGDDIMGSDYGAVTRAYNGGNPLDLRFQDIQAYHASVFGKYGLPAKAWTPYLPFEQYINTGDWNSAQAVWEKTLSAGLGMQAVQYQYELLSGVLNGQGASRQDAATWETVVFGATASYGAALANAGGNAQEASLRNADFIEGWAYVSATGQWAKTGVYTGAGGRPGAMTYTYADPTESAYLTAERQSRLTHFGDNVLHIGAFSSQKLAENGIGQLAVGTTQLTGATTMTSPDVWTASNGATYTFTGNDITGLGTLTIADSLLGNSAADDIVLQNFDLSQAIFDSAGFDGIRLSGSVSISADGAPQAGAQTFTVAYDTAVDGPLTLKMQLSGALPTDFEVLVGGQVMALNSDGSFSVTIQAGESGATFSLLDVTPDDGTSDLSAGATLQLAAIPPSSGGPGQSTTGAAAFYTYTYQPKSSDVSPLPQNMTQISGHLVGQVGVYQGDGGDDLIVAAYANDDIEAANSVNDSIIGGTGSNTIVGGQGNDVITLQGAQDAVTLGGGHDTVNGGTGLDTIKSDAGDAIVNAHKGTDVILLGSGTNEVYADSQASVAQAIAQLASASASGLKGDLISVLDGDDTIVGGLGNDLINAGNGHSVVVMGPGQDTFLGGWDLTEGTGNWYTQIQGNIITVYNVDAEPETYVNPYAQPYNGNFIIDGNSTINAGPSSHTVFGGSGTDIIVLGNGDNYVQTGSGATTVFGGMGDDTIVAGSGNDWLRGGGGNTLIEGGSGNDNILGGDGNNTIFGGSGNSTITSASIATSLENNGHWTGDNLIHNYVYTGSGNDLVIGSPGSDTLIAGSGTVTLQGGIGTEYLVGGTGADLLIGGSGNDTLTAGSGRDSLFAHGAASTTSWLYGGDGVDVIEGGSGSNVIDAGNGGVANDPTLVIASSDSSSFTTIYGGLGIDQLQGGAGTNLIYAGDGGSSQTATVVIAGSGATTAIGGTGTDWIQGGSGTDLLEAGDGGTGGAATTVYAGTGVATLVGGAGSDLLQDTNSGEDLLIAGSGNDTLVGIGADTFVAGPGTDVFNNLDSSLTLVVNGGFGDGAIYDYNGGGTQNLVFGSDIQATDLVGGVAWDARGLLSLTLGGARGTITVEGGLTGSLGSALFGGQGTQAPVGAAGIAALMKGAFGVDQQVQYGNYAEYVYVVVSDGESIAPLQDSDTVSAWGSNDTINGSWASWMPAQIFSGGAADVLLGGAGRDTLVAAGDNASVTAGAGGALVTISGANSVATNTSATSSLTASGFQDTLQGGTGITHFGVNDPSAVIVSSNPTGHDDVTATVSYTLPTHVDILTLTGNANITGTGNAEANTITGGAGNDTLVAGAGVATLVAGSGVTAFVVDNSADVVQNSYSSQAGADSVLASATFTLPSNVNTLVLTGSGAIKGTGNSGADTLVSNTGIDTLVGVSGNDIFVVKNSSDVLQEQAGSANDTVQSSVTFALASGINTLVLTGTTNLKGTANAGNDTLVSNSGVDTLVGGAGRDAIYVNNASDVVQVGSPSGDTIYSSVNYALPANVDVLQLTGTSNLWGRGNGDTDTLIGGVGNDTLYAGTAADVLVAGSGPTTFVVNNTGDVVQDAYPGVADTIQSSVSFTAATNVGTMVMTGSNSVVATANGGNDTLVSNSGVDTLVAGAGGDVLVINNAADVVQNVTSNDTVESSVSLIVPSNVTVLTLIGSSNLQATTNGGNDVLTGNAGSDVLVATTGTDTLVAGTGVATLVGGSGADVFVVDSASDVVSLTGAHGADSILSSVSFTLPSGVNVLTLMGSANLTGAATSGNNLLTGNAGNDTLRAGSGSDTLVAGAGPATLVGGAGADTFVIDSTADVITGVSTVAGNTIESSVNDTMAANVTVLQLLGSANLVGTGNSLVDTMTANSGNDTLVAGTGVAHLIGGRGADVFVINNVGDTVSDPDYGDKGASDTIESTVNYTLPSTVNELILEGSGNLTATGNQNADVLVGNAGSDSLVAGIGNDTLVAGSGVATLVGGAGNDTFVVDNALDRIVSAMAGHDNVLETSVTYTLPVNVNKLVLTGSGAIVGTANSANDSLVGNGGADTLVAGSGNDTLVAGAGVATMVAGAGTDVFVVDNKQDVVQDTIAGGADTLLTSVDFTLPTNVNVLKVTGSASVSVVGNTAADTLVGGAGKDTLVAGSGVATMIGGSGPTAFAVDNKLDVVQGGSGADTVMSSVTYTLPTSVNILLLTGTDSIKGTANAGNDTLVSNSGVDTLVGGVGNEVFVVNNSADTVKNSTPTASDTVQSNVNFTLPANVDTLMLQGNVALKGTANGDNDTLVSNLAVDTLVGGAGNDVFVVKNAADVVRDSIVGTASSILSSVSFTLPANVDALTLTGTAALVATGNSDADVLAANSGNDTLVAGTGVATMVGGAGNVVFVVNNAGDVVQDSVPSASDTVESSVGYSTPTNVRTLILTGSSSITATATDANDTLVSNAGVDTLVGASAGHDVFVINNGGDVLQNAIAGDTVVSAVAYNVSIASLFESLSGSTALAVTVSGANDTLAANTGDDTLVASQTNQTLVGGSGNDTFVVQNSSDVIADVSVGGTDAVFSSGNYTLPQFVDTLTLTGTASATGAGNSDMVNVLIANAGTDTLLGRAFVNTLIGGAGTDQIYAGPGLNVIHAGSGGTAGNPTTVWGDNTGAKPTMTDIIYGDSGINVLHGGRGSNFIYGGTGTTQIWGGGGVSDYLVAGNGGTASNPTQVYSRSDVTTNTTIIGGSGFDMLEGGGGHDLILAGTGTATLQAAGGHDSLYGASNSKMYDTSGNALLVASSGAETLSGWGSDTLVAGSGTDQMFGGSGSQILDEFNLGFGQVTVGSVNGQGTWNTSHETLQFGAGIDIGALSYSGSVTGIYGTTDEMALVLHDGSGSVLVAGGLIPGAITGVTLVDAGNGEESLDTLMNSFGLTDEFFTQGLNVYEINTGDDQSLAPSQDSTANLWAFGNGDVVNTLASLITTTYAFGAGSTVSGANVWSAGDNEFINLARTPTQWGRATVTGANDTVSAIGGNSEVTLMGANDVFEAPADGATYELDVMSSYTLPTNVRTMTLDSTVGGLVGTSNARGGYLVAGGGSDTLVGGAGQDTLEADGAGDVLVGGAGAETYVIEGSGDGIRFGSGPVSLNTVRSAYSYTLNGGASTLVIIGDHALGQGDSGADTLTAIAQYDTLVGGSGPDTLVDHANGAQVTLVGGTGNDLFVINSGQDVVIDNSSTTNDTIQSGATYTLPANVNTLVLTGTYAVAGTANSGNDLLEANNGIDTLRAGSGNDTLVAGGGNDTMVFNSSFKQDDVLTTPGNHVTLYFDSTVSKTSLSYSVLMGPTGSLPSLVVTGPAGAAVTVAGGLVPGSIAAVDFGDGTSASVGQLVAPSGHATVAGSNGNLIITTPDGDVLAGGSGQDTLLAWGNNDTLHAGASGSMIFEGGTGNVVTGSSGSDTLAAAGANSTLVGGTGNEVFIVSDSSTTISQAVQNGHDTVESSVNYTLPANVDYLLLAGSKALQATGNAQSDTLVGNSGLDTLVAGAGLATLVGGAAGDVFVVNNGADVVQAMPNTSDTILSTAASFTLPSSVSYLELTTYGTSGTAYGPGDVLRADVGSETLYAAASGRDTLYAEGSDTLYGGAGDDYLVAAASSGGTLVSGTGRDTLETDSPNYVAIYVNNSGDMLVFGAEATATNLFFSVNYTLASSNFGGGNVGVELTGSSNLYFRDAVSEDSIDMYGNSGNDTMIGYDGNKNTFHAGTGIDTFVGGKGIVGLWSQNVYYVNSAADVIVAGAGASNSVFASSNYALGAGVDALTMTGSGLVGQANADNDTLTAQYGSTTLVGGTGNDLFIVSAATDVVSVGAGAGSDTIQTSVSYTLPANVQTLALTGSSAITGTGNGATSLVIGGTVADTLKGGTGIAALEAGISGAQVLKAPSNQAALIGGGSVDTLAGAAFKDFYATGLGGDSITPGAVANVVAFNKGDGPATLAAVASASNILSLGGGIDTEGLTLTKSGNDLVLGTSSGDSVTFSNWYGSVQNQTTSILQVIESASSHYNPSGGDTLRNQPIYEFNFTALVSQFNTAGSPPGWSLTSNLGGDTLSGSATQAYGGDLAYYEGEYGSLTGINLSAVQATLMNASFATGLQTIDSWASISGGATQLDMIEPPPRRSGDPVGSLTPRRASAQSVRTERGDGTRVTAQALAPWLAGTPHVVPASRDEAISRSWGMLHAALDANDGVGPAGAEAWTDDPIAPWVTAASSVDPLHAHAAHGAQATRRLFSEKIL